MYGENGFMSVFVTLGIVVLIASPFVATGWDTGVMSGTIIGYDSNMFGTKTVFVLEDRTVFNGENGMSQSQVRLCSDADDVDIHKQIEEVINKKVVIEYKERRVGVYGLSLCHDAPITKISLYNQTKTINETKITVVN